MLLQSQQKETETLPQFAAETEGGNDSYLACTRLAILSTKRMHFLAVQR